MYPNLAIVFSETTFHVHVKIGSEHQKHLKWGPTPPGQKLHRDIPIKHGIIEDYGGFRLILKTEIKSEQKIPLKF